METSAIRSKLERAPRILLIRLRSLGDSVLTLPLLEALRQWRLDLAVDVMVEAPFEPVFAGHPLVHELLVLRSRQDDCARGWSKIRAIREMRRRRYAAVVNLHGGTTSVILTLAGTGGLRIGQATHRWSGAYHARIPPSNEVWGSDGIHTVEHQMTFLAWLGIPVPAVPAGRLPVADEARRRVRERLERAGLGQSPYCVVHPTATLFTKQWPEANFAEVADWLAAEAGLKVILTSGPRESQVLLNVAGHAREEHRYWADLSLGELFALLDGCSLYLGNDSGPAHAAATLGKPVVAVWGSSDFRAWRPWGTDFEVIRSFLPCMPCPGYTCEAFGRPRCILEIRPAQVREACARLIARAPGTGRA